MQTIKKAAQAVSQALPVKAEPTNKTAQSQPAASKPTGISLPKSNGDVSNTAPRTPRTPADEAIAFFSGSEASADGTLLQVWELSLEDDGGPSYEKSVSCHAQRLRNADWLHSQYIRLPPPVRPYILRISLSPGSVATRNGILKTDFPLDGGAFERAVWKERKLPTDVSK